MGLTKQPPDEFVVVTRAPLSLPPDFLLRPPAPGAPRPQETSVQEMAKKTLYGSGTPGARSARSKGEQALLDRAGAERARPGIRGVVDQETEALAEADETLLETLVFWKPPERPTAIVDANKEVRRLQQASALGEPPAKGETATIERSQKTIFDILF